MGMKSDLRDRVRRARIDTSESQTCLEKARSYIFKGFKIDGSKVGGIKGMDSESRTPTRVSEMGSNAQPQLILYYRIRFQKCSENIMMASTYTGSLLSTFYMNSNSEYGRQHLCI